MARWIEPEPEVADPHVVAQGAIRAEERVDPRLLLEAPTDVLLALETKLVPWVQRAHPKAIVKSDDDVIADRERSARVRQGREQRMLARRRARR